MTFIKVGIFLGILIVSFAHGFEVDVCKHGNFYLILNGLSKHFDIDDSFNNNSLNERNWGVGIQYDCKRNSNAYGWILNAGEYKDSLNSTAFYAGGAGMYDLYGKDGWFVSGGIQGSFFYSNQYNQGRPFIAFLPVLSIGEDRASLNIAMIPKFSQFTDAGVVFMQLKLALPR